MACGCLEAFDEVQTERYDLARELAFFNNPNLDLYDMKNPVSHGDEVDKVR
jgi:hypothetical protein